MILELKNQNPQKLNTQNTSLLIDSHNTENNCKNDSFNRKNIRRLQKFPTIKAMELKHANN